MKPRSAYRILQITALPFPPEIRVLKEALSLRAAGYGSGVMCPPIAGRPARETWRGIDIFRPDALAGAAARLDKLQYQSAFFSPAWHRGLQQVLREYRPDVLHVHDIWLGRTALRACTTEKFVMDLHENMPAAVVEYQSGYRGAFRWFNAVFKNHPRVFAYERALLERSDLVLAVVHEARERILAAHPRLEAARVVNVENLESREFLSAPTGGQQVIADDHYSILYIGGFGPHRGIDTLIRAMHVLKTRGLNARLHLVGGKEGTAYLTMLRELIAELDVSSHVNIVSWVPSDSVLSYVNQASLCAVPHHSNPHTDSTIPHKLFQYMIAARPVLVSTSLPLARTVAAADCGVIFKAGDPDDCAVKIAELANDPQRAARLGARGRRYVQEAGHNWEEESAPRLVAAYDRLLGCSEAERTADQLLASHA
jgi:glycosyltransferase involved in cell wall biosynthesis